MESQLLDVITRQSDGPVETPVICSYLPEEQMTGASVHPPSSLERNTVAAKNLDSKSKNIMAAVMKLADMAEENEVHIADVVRHKGPGILIPEDMDLDQGIKILVRKRDEENEMTYVQAEIPAFPYDGAFALKLAMEELFGYVVSKRCFCGQNHNVETEIVTDAQGTMVTVPWGEFEVPGVDGHLATGVARQGKRVIFKLEGNIRGKNKKVFNLLVAKTKEIVARQSIYKGKALEVKFKDDDGRTFPVPEIKFLDVASAKKPIYSRDLEEQFDNDVLAYITHADLVRPLNGGTLKRGVLFAGPYGTGKTLAANWVAKEATARQWTYIYVTNPDEFYDAHLLARAYQPAVIFVEDVDKIAGQDRTQEVDRLLNTLDGVDTKRLDIVVIFTTNHGDKITQAMYRPGRVDFLMKVEPPDAEAAVRIAIEYAGGQDRIDGTPEDFRDAGIALAGKIPATIKEAVARAQIRAVIRTGDSLAPISNADLTAAAISIERERNTYEATPEDEVMRMGRRIGAAVLGEARVLVRNGRTPVAN